jgi:acyl-CoA thioesterase II
MTAAPPTRTLADALDLEHVDGSCYIAPAGEQRHIFGGLLVAHAVRAARMNVHGHKPIRAAQVSFVAAGDGRHPVRFDVERTREGRSFSTRRVVATQDDHALIVATLDFHADEPGMDYETGFGDAPDPETLETGRYDSDLVESVDVPVGAVADRAPHARQAWVRSRTALPDDDLVHLDAVAFMSDLGPTRAVREPHADHPGVERRMSVSLDHSVWFHRPCRADEWLLYELVPVSTARGRGLAFGSIWDRSGHLVASVAQAALLRLPEK